MLRGDRSDPRRKFDPRNAQTIRVSNPQIRHIHSSHLSLGECRPGNPPADSPLAELLETFDEQIAHYDREAKVLLPKLAPEAVRMCDIPGVGPISALYFAALIGNPQRFEKARDVGAYLGLCRRRNDSGDYKFELRITKAGDRYMRALLVNCAAHIIGPSGKDSDLRTWGLTPEITCDELNSRNGGTSRGSASA